MERCIRILTLHLIVIRTIHHVPKAAPIQVPVIDSVLDVLEILSLIWLAYNFERKRRMNFIVHQQKRTAVGLLHEFEPTEEEVKAVEAVLARARESEECKSE